MGKHSKGLIGEKPRSMHDICAYRNTKKKKAQRDNIKMRSYQQIVAKAKPDKIEKTIKELQTKERAGKLEHNEYIKLMANKKMLKKKQEKAHGKDAKTAPKGPDEFHFSAEEIRTGKFYETPREAQVDPLLDPEPEHNFLPGYEPNSSLRPTGLPSRMAGNFISEGTIAKQPMIYSQEPVRVEPEKKQRPQVERDEADPLTSQMFENEIIHRRKLEEKKEPVKLPQVVKKPEPEETKKESVVVTKRPMFMPSSVRANKRKKEEVSLAENKVEPVIKPSVEEVKRDQPKYKKVTNVPAPENLMLFDSSDESDEEGMGKQKHSDLKELIKDLE